MISTQPLALTADMVTSKYYSAVKRSVHVLSENILKGLHLGFLSIAVGGCSSTRAVCSQFFYSGTAGLAISDKHTKN